MLLPNKTKLYKPDGTFVSEYPKDSISNFIGVSNGYWGTYKREYQKSHLVAFFDKDWNMKQSFFPFDAESVTVFRWLHRAQIQRRKRPSVYRD